MFRSFNISTVEFSDKIIADEWGKKEFQMGAAKVDSILASPFEEVLFLDPDNFVLCDPTYLFDTKIFKK
jgi:site-specific DNA-adenine methylase